MFTRLGLSLAVFAVAGVLAGCGGTKTVTVTTQASTPAVTTTTATTPTTTTATTPPTTTTAPSITASQLKAAEAADPALKQQIAQAVAACKSSVTSTPNLNAADKASLNTICDKMRTGNTAGIQQATSQVCRQIIKDSVPAAAQAQSLAACPKP
ncbi:MAG TPA: hypothetical protein VIJ51_09525 [Solirubrobacteraceae bacterium]